MKKITLLLSLMILTIGHLLAQNPYYDAIKLAKYVKGNKLSYSNYTSKDQMILDSTRIALMSRNASGDDILIKSINDKLAIIKKQKKDTIYSILYKYKIIETSDTTNATALKKAIQKNPFLSGIDAAGLTQGSHGEINFKSLIKSGANSLTGLDVTTAAEGVAQFMISRAKEELTISFFSRFKKCVLENPELQVMFPETTIVLGKLLAYQYPEMLPALQKAFYDDLNLLPIHLDDVLELPKYNELLQDLPEVKIVIHSLRIVSSLESEDTHPADVINQLASLSEWNDEMAATVTQNMGSAIRLGDIFSSSLRYHGKENSGWISSRELKQLVDDDNVFKIYLALIYQQVIHLSLEYPSSSVDSIMFTAQTGRQISFASLMRSNKNNLILFQNKISEFIHLTDRLKLTLDELKPKKDRTADDYYNYITQSMDVIEYTFNIVRVFDADFMKQDYCRMVRSCNNLWFNIYQKEYNSAVLNATDILTSVQVITEQQQQQIITAGRKIIKILKVENINDHALKVIASKQESKISPTDLKYVSLHANTITGLDEKQKIGISKLVSIDVNNILEHFKNIIPEISKYGLFISNIASAKTADEVEKIIESAVLPVGSSSVKKNSAWNLSVQSYLGAYWRTSCNRGKNDRPWNDKFGVTAPIGLSVSYGFQNYGSISLFGSLLDLGAIVDYQLKYDTVVSNSATAVKTTKNYTIKLGQIFSPGAYVVYGFAGNLPLSLGFGGQYGPGLNSINTKGVSVLDNPYWRWNAFLCVDIPFFNVYNKERRLKSK